MFLKPSLLFTFVSIFLSRCNGENLTAEQCLVEIKELEKRIQILEGSSSESNSLHPSANSTGSKVAFYTQLSRDVEKLGNHQTIVFDTVTTNIGSGYKVQNGLFTAPVTGTYVFFWLITNKDHNFMNTELVKNSVVCGKSISDASNHSDFAASSNTAVLQLNEGDDVWVRSGTWHSAAVAGDYYSTFSGWLLYEG